MSRESLPVPGNWSVSVAGCVDSGQLLSSQCQLPHQLGLQGSLLRVGSQTAVHSAGLSHHVPAHSECPCVSELALF